MSHENQIVNKGVEQSSAARLPVPCPRIPISVRPGTMEDLPFIDALQKKHTKQVGFMPTKQFEGKIKIGHVLIAESDEATKARSDEGEEKDPIAASPAFPSVASSLRRSVAVPLGYLIGNDQYFKRDDVGIIYQINIAQSHRRSLVGATLLKAQFDRSAYGCKLYCCWCAQDIEANYFWESLGFIPLAFRAGSRGKGRVHIFWQRRIREGDTTTPYWFPSQTTSGSIREDRIVLPIPPGTHWKDAKPIVLPGEPATPALPEMKKKSRGKLPVVQKAKTTLGRLQFVTPKAPAESKPKREPRQKQKNDPRLVAAARELRDRWLEHISANPLLSNGKYEISRLPEPCPQRPSLPPSLPLLAA